jgi:hypothetical protein
VAVSSCRMEATSAPAEQRAQEILGGLVLTDGGLERIAIDREGPPITPGAPRWCVFARKVWQRPAENES